MTDRVVGLLKLGREVSDMGVEVIIPVVVLIIVLALVLNHDRRTGGK